MQIDLQRMPIIAFSAGLLAAATAIAEFSGIRIDYASWAPLAQVLLGLIFGWLYAGWRQMPAVQIATEYVFAASLISIAILFYSYATARPALPLADPWLAHADVLLGFHVPSVVAWIDRSAILSWVFEITYHSMAVQLFTIPILLALTGKQDAGNRMLLCYALICVIACTISIYFPSIEAFAHYGIRASDLKNLSGAFGYHFHTTFFAARNDEIFTLSLGMTSGIISFPSIHAALAILCGYATWPIRLLRYPGLVWNAFMFAATVPVGAHYGVEVVAGAGLACVVIWAVRAFPMPAFQWPLPASVRPQGYRT